jgi:hypothetical protein
MRARTALLLILLVLASPGRPRAEPPSGGVAWRPVAGERLIRLPAGYLEKAIERDFRGSTLAAALDETGQALTDRAVGLGDLTAAVERAAGPEREALQQRLLEEKQGYLRLMGRRHDLEREHLTIRLALYRRLLDGAGRDGTGRDGAGDDPAAAPTAASRRQAQRRLEAAAATVDARLFADGTAAESRYAGEYRRHAAALDRLVAAINHHPMNAAPDVDAVAVDGRGIDRREHLRQLAGRAEAELALLDQQDLVLAHMAKLVALDAMALADAMDGREAEAAARPELRDVSAAVGFFITRD